MARSVFALSAPCEVTAQAANRPPRCRRRSPVSGRSRCLPASRSLQVHGTRPGDWLAITTVIASQFGRLTKCLMRMGHAGTRGGDSAVRAAAGDVGAASAPCRLREEAPDARASRAVRTAPSWSKPCMTRVGPRAAPLRRPPEGAFPGVVRRGGGARDVRGRVAGAGRRARLRARALRRTVHADAGAPARRADEREVVAVLGGRRATAAPARAGAWRWECARRRRAMSRPMRDGRRQRALRGADGGG